MASVRGDLEAEQLLFDELAMGISQFSIHDQEVDEERWLPTTQGLLVQQAPVFSAHNTVPPAFGDHEELFHGSRSISRQHARCPSVLPGRHPPPVYQIPDYVFYLAKNEQMVLDALFHGTPDDSEAMAKIVVTYAFPLMESFHGQRLLSSVLSRCDHALLDSIVANITRDRRRFFRICVDRSDQVVRMVRYCGSCRQFQHFGDAIMTWMDPLRVEDFVMDTSRHRIVEAFVECAPPCLAGFTIDVVVMNCIAIACRPSGVSLLQTCLNFSKGTTKDNMLTALSCSSLHLAQNPYGNYIVQDVLKREDPSQLAIIASRFRHNYVELSRNKYGSNVVETCLNVFDDEERYAIVNELIQYPHFRDLVADEYANYVISKALWTCKGHIRRTRANAILSLRNFNRRHPYCLKIFATLTKLGYPTYRLQASKEAVPVYSSSSEDVVIQLSGGSRCVLGDYSVPECLEMFRACSINI